MKFSVLRSSWLVILAGVLFSLYLLWQVPDGVYFSGDGGLKALLAQQLSTGTIRFDLIQPLNNWVQNLWSQGLYPYEEPFVYHLENRYFITFPFPFSLVTAPFYAFFGYRGLYFVPLVATWIIWVVFYLMCQRLNFSPFNTFLALTILVFSSNLTLYSAMYWEHTLAVALCFVGLAILFISRNISDISINSLVLSGCAIGLSAWVRSEFLAMVGTSAFLAFLIAIFRNRLQKKKDYLNQFFLVNSKIVVFLASLFSTVILFFIANKLIYNHFLGIHALQIVDNFSWSQRLTEAWESFREISISFFDYFPVALFALLYLLLFLLNKLTNRFNSRFLVFGLVLITFLSGIYLILAGGIVGLKSFVKQWGILLLLASTWLFLLRKVKVKLNTKMTFIYLICLLFTIGVALLVDSGADEIAVGGKQWGPRYLLILIPLVALLAVEELSLLRKSSNFASNLSLLVFGALLVIGFHKNLYEGTAFFQQAHQGVAPAIQELQKNSNSVIVVSHQYVTQLLEPSIRGEKFFFRAEDPESLLKLSTVLVDQNQSSFIYVCYPHRPCDLPQENSNRFSFSNQNQDFEIRFHDLGKLGKYPTYEATIVPL
ncbi:MAG: LA_3751/LA_3752 family putative glycosyltransferase [Cyanophyceae cyanobacterium]